MHLLTPPEKGLAFGSPKHPFISMSIIHLSSKSPRIKKFLDGPEDGIRWEGTSIRSFCFFMRCLVLSSYIFEVINTLSIISVGAWLEGKNHFFAPTEIIATVLIMMAEMDGVLVKDRFSIGYNFPLLEL